MSSAVQPPRDSLSAMADAPPPSARPARLSDYLSAHLDQPPHLSNLQSTPASTTLSTATPLNIPVEDGTVPAFLHLPATFSTSQPTTGSPSTTTAAIFLSGAGGGVVGPSGLYLSLAAKLASLPASPHCSPLPALRLDYRYPARTTPCVQDVRAAMDTLESRYGLRRFVLVGWSFGGAPVFATAAAEPERVVGCATVASQTAETEGIAQLPPRPVLLLHGTGDRTLSVECARRLYGAYGDVGQREMVLFEGDDHALTRNAREVEELVGGFVLRCAQVPEAGGLVKEVLRRDVLEDGERVELMRKGGDLRGEESVE